MNCKHCGQRIENDGYTNTWYHPELCDGAPDAGKNAHGLHCSLDSEEVAEPMPEIAWLVEKSHSQYGSVFLSVRADGFVWLPNANDAIRFSRKIDGDKICYIVKDADRVCEHIWGI
jgi:hypothetical protein